MSRGQQHTSWTFLTNHAQVFLCIAQNSDVRLRDIAQAVGITERAAQRIVADLVEAGYLERGRIGRRNRYAIDPDVELRHAAQKGHSVGELLSLLQTRDHVEGRRPTHAELAADLRRLAPEERDELLRGLGAG